MSLTEAYRTFLEPSPENSTSQIIEGTNGNDNLIGTDSSDLIKGFQGNDTLFGLNSADNLFGFEGNDVIFGNPDKDFLEGNDGHDTLYGGQGIDTLLGHAGEDVLFGELGSDYISGGDGHDWQSGNQGYDEIRGGQGRDTLYGGQDGDSLIGGNDTDLVVGDGGDDLLIGVDVIAETPGFFELDTLVGGEGVDTFILGDEFQSYYNDTDLENLGIGDYALLQDFNASEDRIQLHGTSENYQLGTPPLDLPNGTAVYQNIEGQDELIAIIQDSDLTTLMGESFEFVLSPELSSIDATLEENTEDVWVDTSDWFVPDVTLILGGENDDILTGNEGENFIADEAGNDLITGGESRDNLIGRSGNDTLYGGGGNDNLVGGLGNDFISGDEGMDVLLGVSDLLVEVDSTNPGFGEIDTLTGGPGIDFFHLGDDFSEIIDTLEADFGIIVNLPNESFTYYVGQGDNDFALIADFDLLDDFIILSSVSPNITISDLTVEEIGTGAAIYSNGDRIAFLPGIEAEQLFYNSESGGIFGMPDVL